MTELRDEIRRSDYRRNTAIAAAVLWLSGLIWLALATQIPWLGWLQMTAAIVLFVACRSAGTRGE
jgi:fatty acid desaturase